MEFNQWLGEYMQKLYPGDAWWWQGTNITLHDDYSTLKDCWNAAQEEARKEKINECNALLEELYPLRVYEVNTRQTNKEQTNENR